MKETRDITAPQPGFWMVKLVKHGPEVPASIQRLPVADEPGNPREDHSTYLAAFINGEPVDTDHVWLRKGRAITEAEYRYQIADQRWCRANAPEQPKADPTKPIDPLTAPLPF